MPRVGEALLEFGRIVRQLVAGTARAWWALLPQLLALHMAGWLVYELTFRVASWATYAFSWLALGVFAFGFLVVLTSVVLQLRLVANFTGGRRLVPSELKAEQHRTHDDEFGRFLGLTMLPFLCIYTAFGELNTRMERLVHESIAIQGPWSGETVSQQFALHPWWPRGVLMLTALLLIFVLRRLFDAMHKQTGRRLLGVVAAYFECLFILGLIFLARRIAVDLEVYLGMRRIAQWWSDLHTWVTSFGSGASATLEMLTIIWGVFWPAFSTVVVYTVVWFALAGLVHGSKVVTLADLWQSGVSPRVALRALLRREPAEEIRGSKSARTVVLTLQGVIFGDLDDKYIPALQAGRLTWRAGVLFFVALCFLHSGIDVVHDLVKNVVIIDVIGGQLYDTWFRILPVVNLVVGLVFEPIRLTLLAVAFSICFQRLGKDAGETVEPETEVAV